MKTAIASKLSRQTASAKAAMASLLWFAAGAGAAPPSLVPEHVGPNSSSARWAAGTYDYRALSDGSVKGRESFYLTVHPDGTRTMRTMVDNFSRGVQVDVVLRADAKFRPLDAYVRTMTAGKLKGSGFFAVSGDQLLATVVGADGAQIRETIKVPADFSLGTHPLSLDGWASWYLKPIPSIAQPGTIYLINGDAKNDRPMLGTLLPVALVYLGKEWVTVPAGTFDTHHFSIAGDSELWVTGPDRLLVRYVWRKIDREYLLVSLRGSTGEAKNGEGNPS